MLDLNDLRYFVRVVECGGLTAASRNLNVPKSTVSHRLQQLEASLGGENTTVTVFRLATLRDASRLRQGSPSAARD
jgi:Bacterial regulatory helix-turn-helix protein, lysR family